MRPIYLLASLAILGCTTCAWFILGAALGARTSDARHSLGKEVAGLWGPPVEQLHPQAWYETPNAKGGKANVLPGRSKVDVTLKYERKRRGLLWHRTYAADLRASYTFTNPTRISQTLYIEFPLPQGTSGLEGFQFKIDKQDNQAPALPGQRGVVTRAVTVPPLESVTLNVAYQTRGTNDWTYRFPDNQRIGGFELNMHTDFAEIDFPVGTGSPSKRVLTDHSGELAWTFPDVLGAPNIGMSMPKELNAGPVAARIAFYAPVSLLFFVTIVLLLGTLRGVPLHPMHVFFVAAGFFAFHLLFAYLVDLLEIRVSFLIATLTSLALVCGYLRAVGGRALLLIALPAQLVYLVLFSASFFIDGLTGITLTGCAVLTLAILMICTAKVDWRTRFQTRPNKSCPPQPPAIAGNAQ